MKKFLHTLLMLFFCQISFGQLISTNDSTNICQGDSVFILAKYSIGNTYQWKRNGINIFGATDSIYTAKENGNFSCEITISGIPTISNSILVTYKNQEATIIALNDSLICQNDTTKLKANSGSNIFYQWQKNGINMIGEDSILLNATSSGNYRCILLENSCLDTSNNIQVSVFALPISTISANSITTFCSGDSVELSATNQSGYQFQWLKNNVVLTNDTLYNLHVKNAGNYSCIITDNSCIDTSNSINISVNSNPNAIISSNSIPTFCSGDSIELIANSNPNYSYHWFQNNAVLANNSDKIIAKNNGEYFCVVEKNNCFDTSNVVFVNVKPKPVPNIFANGSTILFHGDSVVLTENSGTGNKYQWLRNDLILPNDTSKNLTVIQTGNYNCIGEKNNCLDTSNLISVSIFPPANSMIIAKGITTFCVGDSVKLQANSDPSLTYQWKRNGSNISGAIDSCFIAKLSGNYQCEIMAGATTTFSNIIKVNAQPIPTAVITASSITTFCVGNSVQLQANSGAGYSYQWLLSQNPISGQTNQNLTVNASGNFNCIVTNNICSDTSNQISVLANPIPTATISASGITTFCSGDSVILQANSGAGYKYQWFLNNGILINDTNQNLTVYNSGTYKCEISIGSCSDTSNQISVLAEPIPTATISASGITTFCAGDSVILQANSSSGYRYQWFLNNGILTNDTNQNLTVYNSGTYKCEISIGSCSDTSNQISVLAEPIPTATISASGITTFCSGDSVILQANSGIGYKYQWFLNNGILPNDTNQNLTVYNSGTYKCEISTGSCSDTSNQISVLAEPIPTATISASGITTFCSGDSVILQVNSGPGYKYQWFLNNGILTNDTNQNLTVYNSGTYKCEISIGSCSDTSNQISVLAEPIPTATISASGITTFCSGDSVILQANSGIGYKYQWFLNNGILPNDTNQNLTVYNSGTYKCEISIGTCSDTSNQISVLAEPIPTATISASGITTFCSGDSVILQVNSGPGYKYQWFLNNGILTNDTNQNLTVYNSGNYKCEISIGSCSDTSNSIKVLANPIPTATISASGITTFCSGDSVILQANSSAGYKYQWLLNNGVLANDTNQNLTVYNSGTYKCEISIGSCSDTSNSIKVLANPIPTATISASGITTFCSGDSVILQANSGAGYNYQWFLNNGVLPNDTNQNLTVYNSGTYKCEISIGSCSDTSNSIKVLANPIPTATISASGITTFCSGDSVILQANSSAGYKYQWFLNNGVLPNDTNQNLTVYTSGTYKCEISIGTCSDTSNQISVLAEPIPTATISASGITTFCSGDSVILQANSGAGYKYQWFLNNGILTNDTNQNLTVYNSGTYKCEISIGTCSDTSNSIKVLANPIPTATISASGITTFCSGDSVILQANSSSGYKYQWFLNNGVLPNDTNQNLTVYSSGTYKCEISIGTCSDTSNQISVLAEPIPTATISASGITTFCSGDSVILQANSSSGYKYQWFLNNGVLPNDTNQNLTVYNSGTYICEISIGTCSDTSNSIKVLANPIPSATISASGITTFCSGDSVVLQANSSSGYKYQWFLNNGVLPNDTNQNLTVYSSGTYKCEISIGSCSDTSNSIKVLANPIPTATISASGITTFCSGDSVILQANSGAGYKYQWFLNNGVLPNDTNQNLTVYNSGTYKCEISIGSCSDTSNQISVLAEPIPTATISASGITTFCSGDSVILQANSGIGFTYQWLQNNSIIIGETGKDLKVFNSGNYSCLINLGSCSDTSNQISVLVNNPPNAMIAASGITTFCMGENVQLQANSGMGFTYQWLFNGNPIVGQTNQNLTANTSGNYQCIVDFMGCSDASNIIKINVINNPVASIMSAGSSPICSGDSLHLFAFSQPNYSYQWQKDSVNISGANQINFYAKTTGFYRVIVAENTCSDTSSNIFVQVDPKPKAVINALSSTNFCQGDSSILKVQTNPNYTYQWLRNQMPIAGANDSILNVFSSGNYQCLVTENFCSDTSNSITILQYLPTNATLSLNGNINFCMGDSLIIEGRSGMNFKYQWFRNNVILPNDTNRTLVVKTTGDYFYELIDSLGCKSRSNLVSTLVNNRPNAMISANGPNQFCAGGQVDLSANIGVNYSYQWLQNGLVISGETMRDLTVNASGNYQCLVTENGCLDTSNTISILVTNPPAAPIFIVGDTSFCQSDSVVLFTHNSTNFKYQWLNNGLILPNDTFPNFAAQVSGNHQVIVSENGCSDTSRTVLVQIIPAPNAIINANNPTSFCLGDSVILSAQVHPNYKYQWLRNGFPLANDTSSNLTVFTSGNYECIITENTCMDTSNAILVTVNNPPNAFIMATGPTTFLSGDSVILQANTSTGFSYQWLSNGLVLTGETDSILKVFNSGNYQVIISQNGCVDTSNVISVTVLPASTSVIIANGPTSFCQGDSVKLQASSGIGFSYQWKRNGVNISGATDSCFFVKTSGNYSCDITISGNTTNSNSIFVQVFMPPIAIAIPQNPTTFCSEDSLIIFSNFGNYTHQWLLNGNLLLGETDSILIVKTAGKYQVIVSENGCVDSSNVVDVIVNNRPNAMISANGATTFCLGDSVLLQANTDTNFTYQWLQNGIPIAGENDSIYLTKISGNYQVVITQNGCSDTSNAIFVTVNNPPNAMIVANGTTTFVAGDSVILQANAGANLMYQWFRNGTAIVGANDSLFTAKLAGNYFCIISRNGCVDSSNVISISVLLPGVTNIIAQGSTNFCLGDSVKLQANSGTGFTYQWQRNGMIISGATDTCYFAKSLGTYNCIISILGNPNTSNSIFVDVTTPPNAMISASGTTNLCSGENVTLTANSGMGFTYQWLENGMPISGQNNSSITTDSTGNYQCIVALNGCADTSNIIQINAFQTPMATISANAATNLCAGQNVELIANLSPSFTYQWQRNGMLLAGQTNPNLIVNIAGNYQVIITENGCSDSSNVISVTVNPNPIAGIMANGLTTFCKGDSVVLVSNSGANYSYQWQLNGFDILGANASSFAADSTGSYRCIVNLNGCKDTSNAIFVNVNLPPNAMISANGPTTFFMGDSVTLSANMGIGLTYQWLRNNIPIAGANSIDFIAKNPGDYQCIVSKNGCPDTSNIISIVVLPPSSTNIIAGGATTFCAGDSVVLIAQNDPTYSYQWLRNGIVIPGATNSNFVAKTSGNYACNITIGGSTNTSNVISVTVNNPPVANISANNPTTFCLGDSVLLSANFGMNFQYQWIRNGVNLPNDTNVTLKVFQAGNYQCLITENNCSDLSNLIAVTVNIPPNAIINAGSSTTFFAGDSVTLFANNGAGITFQWLKDGVPISGETNFSFVADSSGNYQCILIQNGCTDSSNTIVVTVLPTSTLGIIAKGATSFCDGDSVELEATVDSSFMYQWYRNGIPIAFANAHNYFAKISGNYSCDITTSSSTLSSNTIVVSVSMPPLANVTPGGPTTFFAGGSVNLIANAGMGFSYQWLLNGMPIVGQIAQTYFANQTGNFQCIITRNGCSDTSNQVFVNALPLSLAQISANNTTICDGDSVKLSAQSNNLFTYQWRRNGAIIVGANDSILYAKNSGNYTCEIRVFTSIQISNSILVRVNAFPNAMISSNQDTTFCAGDSILLNATFDFNYNYQWQKNGTDIPTANQVNLQVNSSGIYRCIIDNAGCVDTSNQMTIQVNALPLANPGLDQAICLGDTVEIGTKNPMAGHEYFWTSMPAGYTSTQVGDTIIPQESTIYTLRERISASGCELINSVLITVKPKSNANFMLPDTVLALGDSIVFTNLSSGADSCFWNYGDSSFQATSINENGGHIFTQTGIFWITLITKDSVNCPDTIQKRVLVETKNPGQFELSVFPNPTRGEFQVNLNLENSEDVVLNLYDVRGRIIKSTLFENQDSGFHSYNLDLKEQQAGVYLIEVIIGSETLNRGIFQNGVPKDRRLKYRNFTKVVKF